jgi:DNA (cytosine-5)-methyltransferase 1
MRVLSLFSGAGGLDLGLEAAGMTIVGHCEIDRAARQVLRRRWPLTPLHDDVTTLDPEEFRGRVDLVAGGSPCQDLSVGGRRGGLDGARSGLFWHQCRVADRSDAPWVLWENVAGALSSNDGADFAAVLWGLTGALPGVPDGGWRTAGVVVGPKRSAVWRVLDARWYGVAQRRRRVFVVAGPRTHCGPQVLLEPDGVRGDPEQGGIPRQVAAALAAGRNGADGLDLIPAHTGTITESWAKGAGNTQVEEGIVVVVDGRPRRLTPREGERLMGWPDDHTRWAADGQEVADRQRWRMIGNGVAAPVTRWVAQRLVSAVA